MENPTQEGSYKAIKKEIQSLYRKIGNIWNPFLKDFVSFDSTGFRHLIQKGRTPRLRSEQKRRFALVGHARDILSTENFFSEEERIASDGKNAHYWVFLGNRDNVAIKVIVRQIGNGNKHFLSVYGKKQKSPPKSVDL